MTVLSLTSSGEPGDDDARARSLSGELEGIPGVLAAAVWLEAEGRVRTAYLAVARGSDMRTVRDTALDLIRTRELRCTPDQIHIGVPGPSPRFTTRTTDGAGSAAAAALDGLEVHRAENHVRCRVRLLLDGERHEAEARELDTETGRARAAGRATLAALEAALDAVDLGLEGALIQHLFGRPYVIVSVEAATARSHGHLPGIVPVDRSTEEAAALATLRALEGWIDLATGSVY